MKNMVHFGFSIVILIMTVLAFVWLTEIEESNDVVLDLIEQFDAKIEYAQTMRTVVFRRYNLLLSMLLIDDPFEIDEKVSKFYENAYLYRKARAALHAMPMDEEEKKLHVLIDNISSAPQKENNIAVEMFRAGKSRKDIMAIIRLARRNQNELLNTLDRFVELQKSKDETAVNYSHEIFRNSIIWISIMGGIAFLISIMIGRYVASAVAKKNQQLMELGEDMAAAYMKAEEATVIKSDFLATMSHEIRTPLTAIIGFAETSLFADKSLEQRNADTKKIILNGKHLLQIINDVLDLSKVEANKLEFEHINLSPFELLSDIENIVRPAAEEKGLGFSINYSFPLPDNIISDPLRIKQILINLCSNAVKFTENGSVLINVSCNVDENILKFVVVDSGIGIDLAQQDTIFESYKQADSSTTRKFGGTGLGLSLSKILTQRLGGSLNVISEPNKGSEFSFSLPYEKNINSTIIFNKELLPEKNNFNYLDKPTNNLSGQVLLAEDNVNNQELLSLYLKRIGVSVTIAENGQLAIDAVKSNDFDLVLMDMRMPVMSGMEATKILREEGFNKPIIALTANAMAEDKQACLNAGCDDFLSKPIDANNLSETLGKYLT